jgi:hypothetical protein
MSLSSTDASGKFGRRDAEELTALLRDLRVIADRLAYSTVGSEAARDERLTEALALLDLRMRTFVGLTGFWNRLVDSPAVAADVAETFANPLAGERLRAVGEAIAAPPTAPADSATRLHESVLLLARALRSRSRRRTGPLNAHDVRIGYAGLSLAATEAYEQWRETVGGDGEPSGDRESRRRTARRLLAALTVGVAVLGTLSGRVDGEELAGRVRAVWPEIVTEEFSGLGSREIGSREIGTRDLAPVRPAPGGASAPEPGRQPGSEQPGNADEQATPGAGSAEEIQADDITPPSGLRLINPSRATP